MKAFHYWIQWWHHPAQFSLNSISTIKSVISLEIKFPQLSKPEATAARNQSSIDDRTEKKRTHPRTDEDHLFSTGQVCPKNLSKCLKNLCYSAGTTWTSSQQSAMNLITPVSTERARAYYSVWHRICKFTHLFNMIFSDHLRLAKSNIISAGVDNNLTEFTFSISQHF